MEFKLFYSKTLNVCLFLRFILFTFFMLLCISSISIFSTPLCLVPLLYLSCTLFSQIQITQHIVALQ